jgi:hypothetical protein
LPTPTANQTWKSNKGGGAGKNDGTWTGKKRLTLAGMAESGEWSDDELRRKPGKLSPRFSERLMGFPIGWTSLEPLAMDRYRRWLRSHFKS